MSATNQEQTERETLLSEAERIAKVGSWIWNVRTARVRWSDELYRILGYELGSEATTERFFARLHPDDVERIREQSSRAAAEGLTQNASCRIVRPDGTVRHVEMTGAALRDESGELDRIVGTVLDVTESHQTRVALEHTAEILRDAQRIAHLGSWRWLFEGDVGEWSDELLRIHGLWPGPSPSLEQFMALVHPEDRALIASGMEVARAGRGAPSIELRIVRPDGAVRHVVTEMRPLTDDGGQQIGMHGTVLDVTEQRSLERRLLQAQKLEALGRLAGGIAHDFNNLLTIILVSADVARAKKRFEPLDDIIGAAERAKALTQQLLTFSRQAVSRPRSFDAAESTRQGLELLRRLIGEDVTVHYEPPSQRLVVRLDESRFQQIVINLLVNARDAMPRGGSVTVSLEAAHLPQGSLETQPPLPPGSYAVLLVRDAGTGMDEVTLLRALEPFFTTKEVGGGTGLGLSTVFGIASQAGGGVSLESAPEAGTTVRVFLPIVEADAPEHALPGAKPARGGSERILLVEDDAAVARVVEQTLAAAGFQVVTCVRPSAALQAGSLGPAFDLLLTDLMLPEMTGADLAARLLAEGRTRRVLFATGHAPESLGTLPSDAAIVTKPFRPNRLLASVRAVLDGTPLPADD